MGWMSSSGGRPGRGGGRELSWDMLKDDFQIFKKYQVKKSVEQSGLERELGVTCVSWK